MKKEVLMKPESLMKTESFIKNKVPQKEKKTSRGSGVMKFTLRGLCLLCLISTSSLQLLAQEKAYHLVDFVEVKMEIPGGTDSLCTLKFLEEWTIDPQRPSVSKQVLDHDSTCSELWASRPPGQAVIPNSKISYEFHLLDPHLVASGNQAFPEPDSMDEPTRELQEALISIVDRHSEAGSRYRLSDQLLSVIFHETWSLDPSTLVISKKVRALTPVIWQRRQTDKGEPINEAGTERPVFFITELQQIPLRNP